MDGILNITKKALHKSTTVAIQSLNNATNKDREQLLKDLDEDDDYVLTKFKGKYMLEKTLHNINYIYDAL